MTEDEIRVLHVDDDSELAELVATFLERTDDRFSVHVEPSPTAGFDYLMGNPVDCVISDHNMPGATGIEFLERVREQYPDLPFVLYTGKGSEEVASDAISAGVTDYLQKDSGPDHYAVLANRVSNVVDQARSRRAAKRTKIQLSAIVENITDAIVIIDATSTVRFANPAVERVFGYSPSELVDGPLTRLMPDRFREAHDAALDRYLRTGERTMDWQAVELTGQHRDGREIPISVSFSEFEQKGEPRFIGVITDGETDT
ncbi:PAS domain S-box protein [Haloarcula salinisoli]|uniref:PAS domain S-box protein n=1 Tax=Haloarcula salinisoli TaxID=2487746 RepID=A0A8J7YGG3_9EURY|nr:PAS domain S-box protein [Halomicroarcula salinisoli]MBX0302928.1 PAS domain S-box protein [Halomicroarcula salinisoli]